MATKVRLRSISAGLGVFGALEIRVAVTNSPVCLIGESHLMCPLRPEAGEAEAEAEAKAKTEALAGAKAGEHP